MPSKSHILFVKYTLLVSRIKNEKKIANILTHLRPAKKQGQHFFGPAAQHWFVYSTQSMDIFDVGQHKCLGPAKKWTNYIVIFFIPELSERDS